MSRLALAALALSLIVVPMGAVADERETWAALVSGSHVALVRHGNAPPGYGDPPGFKIDDCATQRNLDELGRAQARAVGEAFRQHGVQVDKILSSPFLPLRGDGAAHGAWSRRECVGRGLVRPEPGGGHRLALATPKACD